MKINKYRKNILSILFFLLILIHIKAGAHPVVNNTKTGTNYVQTNPDCAKYRIVDSTPECTQIPGSGVFFRRDCGNAFQVWKAGSDLIFHENGNGSATISGTITNNAQTGIVSISMSNFSTSGQSWDNPCYLPSLNPDYFYTSFSGTITVGSNVYTITQKSSGADFVLGEGANNMSNGSLGIGAWTDGTWGNCGEIFGTLIAFQPGDVCDDGNPNTSNDVIQADGCTCVGSLCDPQLPDKDNDGIADICDLDDDNDGITDVEEGSFCDNFTFNFGSVTQLAGPGNQTDAKPGDVYLYNNGVVGTSISYDMTLKIINVYNGTIDEVSPSIILTSRINFHPWVVYEYAIVEKGSATSSNPDGTPVTLCNFEFILRDVDSALNNDFTEVVGFESNSSANVSFNSAIIEPGGFLGGSPPAGYNFYRLNDAGTGDPNNWRDEINVAVSNSAYWVTLNYPKFSRERFIHGYTGRTTGPQNRGRAFAANNNFCIEEDFDSDGIPNSCDPDSDNDGCPDAVEGSANFTLANIDGDDRLTGSVNSDGIPVVAGANGQGIGTSQDANIQDLNCVDVCDPVISDLPDKDNDGITDICDLDDDNDGILDEEEDDCQDLDALSPNPSINPPGTSLSSILTSINGQTITWTSSGAHNIYVDGGNTAIRYLPCDQLPSNTLTEIGAMLNFSKPIKYLRISGLDVDGPAAELFKDFSILPTSISSNATLNTSNGQITSIGDDQDIELIWDLSTSISSLSFTFLRPLGCGSSVSFKVRFPFCDADNDGIANSCDIDSDNDGCPDAVEGSANFMLSDVDGYGRLIGSVDANGVPSDAGANGQGVGTSQNASIQDPGCEDPCILADYFTCVNYLTLQSTAPCVSDATTNLISSPNGVISCQDLIPGGGSGETYLLCFNPDLGTVFTDIFFNSATEITDIVLIDALVGGDLPCSITGDIFPITVEIFKNGNSVYSGSQQLTNSIQTLSFDVGSITATQGDQIRIELSADNGSLSGFCGIAELAGLRVKGSCGSSDVCDPVTSGNPDKDDDGIADICDLDDDNDGILDLVECPQTQYLSNPSMESYTQCPNLSTEGTIEYAIGWTSSEPPPQTGGQLMVANPPNCNSPKPATSWSNSTALSSGSDGLAWMGIHTGEDATNVLTEPIPNDGKQYVLTFDAGYVVNDPFFVPGILRISGITAGGTEVLLGSATINNQITNTNPNWQEYTISFDAVNEYVRIKFGGLGTTGASYMYFDNLSIMTNCDVDGDGIPNFCDTDSDNDGCPDAIEGNDSFTFADLDENDQLIGSVNADGIPIEAGTNGQGIGTSQNVNGQDPICQAECDVMVTVQQPVYNDNNTSGNLSDDTFTFDILIEGTGPLGWEGGGQTGSYGQTFTFGPYPVDQDGIVFTINDQALGSSCSVDVGVNVNSCIYTGECTCCE